MSVKSGRCDFCKKKCSAGYLLLNEIFTFVEGGVFDVWFKHGNWLLCPSCVQGLRVCKPLIDELLSEGVLV